MSRDELFILKQASWLPMIALCWLYAARGYTSMPRFDMWFWGIAFWVDAIILAAAVTTYMVELQK